MSYFGTLYLDKEKDIVIHLDMEQSVLTYKMFTSNHQSNNLIKNLALVSGQKTTLLDGKPVICGEIPCYI